MPELRPRTRTNDRADQIERAHELPECGVGINIDANRLSSAADEIQKAIDKVPPEITIKFYR